MWVALLGPRQQDAVPVGSPFVPQGCGPVLSPPAGLVVTGVVGPVGETGSVGACGTVVWRGATARRVGSVVSIRALGSTSAAPFLPQCQAGLAVQHLCEGKNSIYAQIDQNDHNAQNVRVITYDR